MRSYRLVVLQLREDLSGQLLAQLDTPLIEGENVPDDPLDEDFVFIQGDQLAEAKRGDLLEQKGVSRPVAAKTLIGYQRGRHFFRFQLFFRLPIHQRLGLGKEIGQ